MLDGTIKIIVLYVCSCVLQYVSESLMSYVALYFPTYVQREAKGAWY